MGNSLITTVIILAEVSVVLLVALILMVILYRRKLTSLQQDSGAQVGESSSSTEVFCQQISSDIVSINEELKALRAQVEKLNVAPQPVLPETAVIESTVPLSQQETDEEITRLVDDAPVADDSSPDQGSESPVDDASAEPVASGEGNRTPEPVVEEGDDLDWGAALDEQLGAVGDADVADESEPEQPETSEPAENLIDGIDLLLDEEDELIDSQPVQKEAVGESNKRPE